MSGSSSGTLFVVATPIGNLEDITLRALRVLRESDVIAAEDTRRTARLLAYHAIATPTLSFHHHNTRSRIPQLVERLQAGQSVALVTDAGTPGVSDPGVELVNASIAAGIRIDPVPGPSAPLAAAVASGFPLEPFTFLGFPPARAKNRESWLKQAATLKHTFGFFEAPHRIGATLSQAASCFGERPIVAARELTKVHQEFLRGSAQEIVDRLIDPRGEFTVVVGPAEVIEEIAESLPTDAALADEFGRLTEHEGFGRREALAALAQNYRRPAREIYAALERAKKSVV